MQMQPNLRKSVRRPLNILVQIDAGEGSPLRDCTIVDISDMGARLAIEHPESVPDHFTMLLTTRGIPCRKCRLVWRRDEHIGVEFDHD